MQNRALRLIFPNTNSTDETHRLAKLNTIEIRADVQLHCLMSRRSLNRADFPLLPNTCPTRLSEKIRFIVPRPRLERYKSFPLYKGLSLWDRLPAHIQKSDCYEVFRNKIKAHARQLYQTPSHTTQPLYMQ